MYFLVKLGRHVNHGERMDPIDFGGQRSRSQWTNMRYGNKLVNLHKSKRHDFIDMFNDTSLYLDDIFTIDNPEFEKYVSDIYPAELQLNKANNSDKETSSLDLNIKVIGSDIHTGVYDKRDDWLSGDVPRLSSYGICILQLVRFARCCTNVLDFHS